MKNIEEMISLNREQAKFYDSIQQAEAETGQGGYAQNKKANVLTRAWAGLRYRQQAAVREAGAEAVMHAAHDRWIAAKTGGSFLEVGCFSGSPSTFKLAQAAGSYRGIELSSSAVAALNQKFTDQGVQGRAQAQAGDLLLMDESCRFDLIYAHGVLHHFENPEPLFEKLAALARPGALLLFVEPSAVNPVYGFLRACYRPFQSDAAWEWPFRRRTVAALERHFEIIEGFGWGRRSLLLSILTGLPLVGAFLTSLYVRLVQQEIAAGWHGKVWNNSMITACYRLRSELPNMHTPPSYTILRLRKLMFSLMRPVCWPAMRLRVAPAIEHLPMLSKLAIDGIIDVGANRGQFTFACRLAHPGVPVMAFEPIPDEAAIFRKVHGRFGWITLVESALSDTAGTAALHLSKSPDSSSLLPIGRLHAELFKDTDEVGLLEVQVRPLDEYAQHWQGRSRQLLKLDVQGLEFKVLRGAHKTLKSCTHVYVECSEVPLYEGQALRSEVETFLEKQGFRCQSHHNELRSNGQLIQADYLFSKVMP